MVHSVETRSDRELLLLGFRDCVDVSTPTVEFAGD